MKIRRPRIDVSPDAPLKFYGFRIDRTGNVYATTTPTTHGRTNANYEAFVGTVAKQGGEWIGKTFTGETRSEFERQQDAGEWVERAAEASQQPTDPGAR